MREIPGLRLIGASPTKIGVLSFVIDGIAPERIGKTLDSYGIAVRVGHHCAQPLHEKFGLPVTSRASFYLYNTKDEVDILINGIYKVKELFG